MAKKNKPKSRAKLGKVPSLNPAKSQSVGMDYFQNLAARMGYGTPSLAEDTQYEMIRLSNNYWLMLTLYRNHWIARRIIDLPAEDMTKKWAKLTCQIPPDDMQRFDRRVRSTYTADRICQAVKWARLYGGAGALICIKGHEKFLSEPLDLDDVTPGSYLGLIPFDRWIGIQPSLGISNDLSRPIDWGLPEAYTVIAEDKGTNFDVHSSRILRFTGPSVPAPEFQAQVYWGISELEIVYEELRKRDNASWAMLQLLFRAQILAQKNPELAQMLSGVGISQQALQAFYSRMQAQNELLSNQSMLVLGENGELQSTQFTFSGLGEIYAQFQMDVAGAAQIPVTRLFGRTITGLGQSNDADQRIYEDMIAQKQNFSLRPQMDKLYPVICMSELGEVPDDLDFDFPSVRTLTEEEKGDMADKGSAPVLASYNAGVIGRKTVLQELRQLSDATGIFSNITDEQIDKAEEGPQLPGEGMPGMGGEGEGGGQGAGGEGPAAGAEGEGGAEGPPDPRKFAHANPKRELREESGGAMDDFKESDHPRDDGGKFSEGSGGGSGKSEESHSGEETRYQYPKAGKKVDGLEVTGKVDNTESIASSLDDYDVRPGIHEVPMAQLKTDLKDLFYAADDFKRCRALAERIKASGEISPLIVVIDKDGPYVLEGAHRLGALGLLGKKSFPAMVVDDLTETEEDAADAAPDESGHGVTIEESGRKDPSSNHQGEQ